MIILTRPRNARVVAVWEGIRRIHGAPSEQANPLMPPDLFDVIDACPTTQVLRTAGRPDEPDLAGARDRALLLVGFVAALRRSELAAVKVDDLDQHPNGMVLSLPPIQDQPDRRTQQTRRPPPGRQPEPVPGDRDPPLARPRQDHRRTATEASAESDKAADRPLKPDSINTIVQAAIGRAGDDPRRLQPTASAPASSPTPTSAAPATAPSPTKPVTDPQATVGAYVRIHEAWQDNAATTLGV